MFALLRFVLAVLASPFKLRSWLEAENAALRHQLIVLRRKVQGRVRLTNNDRWLFIQLYRWFPSILQVVTIIRPETLVRWHRAGFRYHGVSASQHTPEADQASPLTKKKAPVELASAPSQVRGSGLVQRSNYWSEETLTCPTPYPGGLAIVNVSKKLLSLASVGSNPGALKSAAYIPACFPPCRPLVVVLHGSLQTAEDYNHGSGWSTLADQHCFALLFPQQRRSNNAIRAFNWFEPDDSHRDGGEALSIREMIEQVVVDHAIDRQRIFITGLSSGGAMTSVMLATYPDVFAGGAIIAGLPYSGVSSLMQALHRMKGIDVPSDRELDALVRGASRNVDRWPTISVWHGSDDRTVDPSNADAIVRQWQALHGAEHASMRTDLVDGYPRRVWCDSGGREVIEEYRIPNMGHGAPLKAKGADGYGASGDYMLEVGICSTKHIVSFWGLSARRERRKKTILAAMSEAARTLSFWRRVPSGYAQHPARLVEPTAAH